MPRPGVRLRLDETTAWRAGGAAPLGPVRGLRSRNSAGSLRLWRVPCGAWCGLRSLVTRRGVACSGWRRSLLQQLLESLGAALAAGRCWAKVSSPGSWLRLSPAPRHSKCRRWVSSSRGTDGGAGAGAGSGGGGRSCGGAATGHLLSGCIFRGTLVRFRGVWVQTPPVNPERSRFGAVWTEYIF